MSSRQQGLRDESVLRGSVWGGVTDNGQRTCCGSCAHPGNTEGCTRPVWARRAPAGPASRAPGPPGQTPPDPWAPPPPDTAAWTSAPRAPSARPEPRERGLTVASDFSLPRGGDPAAVSECEPDPSRLLSSRGAVLGASVPPSPGDELWQRMPRLPLSSAPHGGEERTFTHLLRNLSHLLTPCEGRIKSTGF